MTKDHGSRPFKETALELCFKAKFLTAGGHDEKLAAPLEC
jgi:hypothetical protein